VAETDASEINLRVNSYGMKEVIEIEDPDDDDDSDSASSSGLNLPLIIGLIVAVLGFIAIIFTIVYLVMKRNKNKKHQEFNDVRRIKKNPKKQQLKKKQVK
jgi:hypothetical protein